MKMENKYHKAYKEVLEILKYIPKEYVDKIPKKMMDTFRENMDQNYNFTMNLNLEFEDQKLMDETKAILANIFRDYWATPEQREKIREKERIELQKIEENKIKFDPEKVFKERKFEKKDSKKEETKINLPVKVEKDHFYKKIIKFLKKLFHIE